MFGRMFFTFSIILVLVMAGISSADLVAYWDFEGDFSDTFGGNDATAQGDTAIVLDPDRGSVAEFDGSGDYLQIPNSPSLNITGDQITLTAWVYFVDVSGDPEIVIAKPFLDGQHTSPYFSYGLHMLSNGTPRFWLSLPGGAQFAPGSPNFESGQWYHMAGVYDGSMMTLYVNGEISATNNNASGNIVGYDTPLFLGINGGRTEPMAGKIDDVQIYNNALDQVEIQAVMLQVGGGYPYARGPIPEDGAIVENTWVTISWRPGDFAVSHDMYLGDNFSDVNEATRDSGSFRGNLTEEFFAAGFIGYPYPDGLVPGTTYYWRIDEVNDADPNSPWKGNVWSFTVPSNSAYNPNPNDGDKFIDPSKAVLSWDAGFGAKLHTMYFDKDFDIVANSTQGFRVGTTTYNPGPLETQTTYYWRVDESDGFTTYTGDVWSFTTAKEGGGIRGDYYKGMNFETYVLTRTDPRIDFSWGTSEPDPAVGTDQFSVRWSGEVEAAFTETYTFYARADDGVRLWVNGIQLVNAWVNQSATEYSGTIDLVAGNTYSIVMEMYENTGDAVAELRWSSPSTPKQLVPQAALAPPVKANNPSPFNGSTGTKLTPILRWDAGDYAASHELYFGTDANAVANATKTSPEYKGTKTLGDESYDPGKLAWATSYYWRVDEVNSVNPDSPWVGNLWSFTTGDFLVIDNFEDYDSGENQIWYFWKDGLGYGVQGSDPYYAGNGTGAAVGDETTASYTEETIVHSGRQAMPLTYDNNKQGYAKYSETELTLTAPRDWTEENVAELSIWFRGYPASTGSFVEAPAGTFTMTGSGTDIWYSADEFHYAFKSLTGVGTIQAQVLSVDNTDPWAKAGVMIRETLDLGSKFAAVYITAGNGCRFQARTDTDIDATSDTSVVTTEQTAITAPYWVKLERDVAGSLRGYYSTNGTNWTAMSWNPQNISMSSNIYIGLAVTAHNASAICEAKFSNVTTTGSVEAQWSHQDIGITSNAAEPLYVAVSNATGNPAVVVNDDPTATQIDTWTEWVIPLSAFADQGINLTNVDSIAIGLGTRGNMTISGGSGKIFFDDIRLYRSGETAE